MEIATKNNFGREEAKGSQEYIEKYFPIVKASEISLKDDLFMHIPNSYHQKLLKDWIFKTFEYKMPDFRAQRIDPSINRKGEIYFSEGNYPAVGFTAKEWKELAEGFWPERGSRLGFFNERIAFIAVMMKKLQASGFNVDEVWKMVCDNSKDLGNYKKLFKSNLQMTGSMEICGFADLANTQKIIIQNNEYCCTPNYYFCGGDYTYSSRDRAFFIIYDLWKYLDVLETSVGWIVLPKV